MTDSDALDAALTHLIAATNNLLADADPDGNHLVAALACLEAQDDLKDLGAVPWSVHECDPSIEGGSNGALVGLNSAIQLLRETGEPAAETIAAQLEAIAKAVS